MPIRVHAGPRFPPTVPAANRLPRRPRRRIQSSLRAEDGKTKAGRQRGGGGGGRGAGPRVGVSVCCRVAAGGRLGGPYRAPRTAGGPWTSPRGVQAPPLSPHAPRLGPGGRSVPEDPASLHCPGTKCLGGSLNFGLACVSSHSRGDCSTRPPACCWGDSPSLDHVPSSLSPPPRCPLPATYSPPPTLPIGALPISFPVPYSLLAFPPFHQWFLSLRPCLRSQPLLLTPPALLIFTLPPAPRQP